MKTVVENTRLAFANEQIERAANYELSTARDIRSLVLCRFMHGEVIDKILHQFQSQEALGADWLGLKLNELLDKILGVNN